MPRRFRFAAVLALVTAVTGLSACGDSGTPSAQDLLKDAFGPNHAVKSGNLGVQLVFDAKGLKTIKGPVSLRLSGPFESQGKGKLPKLDLGLTISGSGTNFSAGAVTTGDKAWIKLQGTAFLVDDPTFAKFKQQYEAAAKKSGGGEGTTLKSLGVDPLRWLKAPKVADTEEAGGAPSYRITAGIDIDKFLNDLSALLSRAGQLGQGAAKIPSTLTPTQRAAIAASVKSAALQVWVGKDDKTLRRLRIDIGIDVPPAIRASAGGLSTGRLMFDLAIADLNKPQTFTAPANARPLSDLRRLISGGSGGASGGGSAPATPSSGGGGNSSGGGSGGSKYLDCVNQAGSDVRALQRCAALVGQ